MANLLEKNNFYKTKDTSIECAWVYKKPQTLLLGVKLAIIVQRQ